MSTLAPFILETTGRPGYPAQKFMKGLTSDTEHTPTATSRPPFRPPNTTVFPNNSSEPSTRTPWRLFLAASLALHHRCLAVTGCSHVLTLLTGFRHGGVAPADAIATWLLHWRPPGGPTRPCLVMSGVCAAPASAESTNSSGIQKCGSAARAAPKKGENLDSSPKQHKNTQVPSTSGPTAKHTKRTTGVFRCPLARRLMLACPAGSAPANMSPSAACW